MAGLRSMGMRTCCFQDFLCLQGRCWTRAWLVGDLPSCSSCARPSLQHSSVMPAGSLLEEGPEATSWLSPDLAAVPSPELQQSWDAVGAVSELLAAERGSPASQGSSDQTARQVGSCLKKCEQLPAVVKRTLDAHELLLSLT